MPDRKEAAHPLARIKRLPGSRETVLVPIPTGATRYTIWLRREVSPQTNPVDSVLRLRHWISMDGGVPWHDQGGCTTAGGAVRIKGTGELQRDSWLMGWIPNPGKVGKVLRVEARNLTDRDWEFGLDVVFDWNPVSVTKQPSPPGSVGETNSAQSGISGVTNTQSTASFSTTGAGSDLYLIAAAGENVHDPPDHNKTFGTATWDGATESMTDIASQSPHTYTSAKMWGLYPSAGTGTVTVNTTSGDSANIWAAAVFANGVNQTTPYRGTASTANGTSSPMDLDISGGFNSGDGDMCVCFYATDQAATAGLTVVSSTALGTDGAATIESMGSGGTNDCLLLKNSTNKDFRVTGSSINEWQAIGIALRGDGGGGGGISIPVAMRSYRKRRVN